MRRKINVTASEMMMELRKQGMSTYDIAKSLDISCFVPYTPKTRKEVFDINVDFEAEINYEDKYITFASYEGEMNISFKDVYDLTQFLAWLMRERDLSVESDADAE